MLSNAGIAAVDHVVKKKKQGEHALSALCRTDTNLDFFHAPPEVPDGDETAFLLSQDKLGQGLLGTRRVHGKHPRIIEFRTGFGQLCNTLVPDIHTW